jgi:amidohydrolase
MIKARAEIEALKGEVVALRRKLHRCPEPGLREYNTSQAIKDFFAGLDVNITDDLFETSVVVDISGSSRRKCYAFRADMDALPVEEKTGLEYASEEKGMMHACGHDAHMAILAGFGKYLALNRHRLAHDIRLIFQPAEESPGGAKPLIDAGVLKNPTVDGIFGLHLFPEVEQGRVGIRPGPMMAQTEEVFIDVEGQSCHGAQPHRGKDALVAACTMVTACQSIVSRSVDPLEPAVLTLGRLVAGERQNIVAGRARIEGTIRAFNEKDFNTLKERLAAIVGGVGQSFGCETGIEFKNGYPAVVNDVRLYDLAIKALGSDNVDIINPVMVAEDFSFYQRHVPGLFLMLGIRNEPKGFIHPLHSCYFAFDEDVLTIGIEVFARILEEI